MLHLHLVIDRVDGFGASLDGEHKPCILQLLLQRRDERGDIRVTLGFLGCQLVRDIFIFGIVGELQRQILHLRLDLIQTQAVSQRSVQLSRLFRHMTTTVAVALLVQSTQ